jgi:DNA polymerase-3 subunit beta
MRLSCLKENLSWGLSIVGRAAAFRSTLPITANVLLKAKGDSLVLAATNLEISLTTNLEAKVEEEGEITVPCRVLSEFIDSLPSEVVDLREEGGQLDVEGERQKARILGMVASDFPLLPKVTGGLELKLPKDVFRRAVNRVIFAAAQDETRPIITGIHAEFRGGLLTLAAADGYRLAVHNIPLPVEVDSLLEVTIPARTLSELSRLIYGEELTVVIDPEHNQALFRFQEVEMVSLLLSGTFPNFRQLIPSGYTTRAEIATPDLLSGVRTACIFAGDGRVVKFDIAEDKLIISARSEEAGENSGEVEAHVEGNEARIAFNGRYLMDFISSFREEKVVMELTSSQAPAVFKPVEGEDYIHIIMPVFVQW